MKIEVRASHSHIRDIFKPPGKMLSEPKHKVHVLFPENNKSYFYPDGSNNEALGEKRSSPVSVVRELGTGDEERGTRIGDKEL